MPSGHCDKCDAMDLLVHVGENTETRQEVWLCGKCADEMSDVEDGPRYYACPVCEKEVCIESDTICSDCFSGGARATVRW
jgi:hypothetical protein